MTDEVGGTGYTSELTVPDAMTDRPYGLGRQWRLCVPS
jgi:hypothetical protein